MRNLFKCDICLQIIEEVSQKDRGAFINLCVYLDGKNPLSPISTNQHAQLCEFRKSDVCHECRRKIAEGLVALLKSMGVK